MDANKAIHICKVLKRQEGINLNWRVLKKYSDDYDDWVTKKAPPKLPKKRIFRKAILKALFG